MSIVIIIIYTALLKLTSLQRYADKTSFLFQEHLRAEHPHCVLNITVSKMTFETDERFKHIKLMLPMRVSKVMLELS